MMTARFFSGASLFALLIVDICCLPVKKGNNAGASYGGSYSNAAPDFGSNQGASSVHFIPNKAPQDVSTTSYQPMPEMSRSQPAVRRQPASPVGFGQPGTTQPAGDDFTWALPPPSPFSGEEETSTGTSGVGSLRPENVSPPLPPSGPMYQAGDLSHYEQNLEFGNFEEETEDQGYLAPPPLPMHESAGPEFTSQPQPDSGSWGTYPYYDFMFLTGQYPPGTYTHSSTDYEQGSDNWQEDHYERYYYYPLNNPGPAEQTASLTFEAPRQPVKTPVMAGYGSGSQPQLHPYGFRKM